MSGRPAPAWLAELQARFGAVLRTPLDRSTGTLRAMTSEYPAEALLDVVDRPGARAADRLAVYNRQYWFRLLTALQTAFPRTARLLGYWRFNEHAARFILERPPRGWDLERVPDGFEEFLVSSLGAAAERELVLEAARIDAAFRAIVRAPVTAPFRPGADDAARLPDARLEPSPATAVIIEHWPLVDLRRALDAVGGAVPSGPHGAKASLEPLAAPRAWALVRRQGGIYRFALEPREGELLLLLRERSVRDALACLEAGCPEAERATLPERVQRWLARGAERGMWCAVVPL